MSASDVPNGPGGSGGSGGADQHGEILKASGPGPSSVQPGMRVNTSDGHSVGTVKEVHQDEFLVDRPLARDLWIPFSAVLSTEAPESKFPGAYGRVAVVLNVSNAHLDSQGWRHA